MSTTSVALTSGAAGADSKQDDAATATPSKKASKPHTLRSKAQKKKQIKVYVDSPYLLQVHPLGLEAKTQVETLLEATFAHVGQRRLEQRRSRSVQRSAAKRQKKRDQQRRKKIGTKSDQEDDKAQEDNAGGHANPSEDDQTKSARVVGPSNGLVCLGLHVGINATCRLLEKKAARLVLLSCDQQPAFLYQHIVSLAASTETPVIGFDGLSKLLSTVLRQKTATCAALSDKSTIVDALLPFSSKLDAPWLRQQQSSQSSSDQPDGSSTFLPLQLQRVEIQPKSENPRRTKAFKGSGDVKKATQRSKEKRKSSQGSGKQQQHQKGTEEMQPSSKRPKLGSQ